VLAEGGVADEEKAGRAHQVSEDLTTIRTARRSGPGVGTDTEAGSLLGTPAYMPPEQANGDVALLDRRADVFGLGASLCEILTGKPPSVGRSAEEVRRKACNGDLADAMTRLDACGADAELVALARGCLAAEAGDRPKDAQAVADGLAGYLNGVQERLRQAELAEAEARAKAVEEAKRRRLTLALAGTVLLALTLGGGGYLYVKGERDARQAQVAREVNDALNKATALREQAKAAPVGSAALFAQAREQAQRALALVESGPADDALKAQGAATASGAGRGGEGPPSARRPRRGPPGPGRDAVGEPIRLRACGAEVPGGGPGLRAGSGRRRAEGSRGAYPATAGGSSGGDHRHSG
jgi:hypothetical protein